jgi:putative glutamine amidotransferase
MSKVVAVTASRRVDGERERVALNAAYVRALTRAGLVPLVVPPMLDPARAAAVVEHVHGLVLTGGEDVDPSRYKAPRHPTVDDANPARDAVEIALIEAAQARGLPLLGICRGIQILNVALGGTLYQDLPSERPTAIDHTDEGARHGLKIAPNSLMSRTVGQVSGGVNSRHHQAIRDLAPPLRAVAWADDELVEGVEAMNGVWSGGWLLAVQWHPEDDVEQALFRHFAEAV